MYVHSQAQVFKSFKLCFQTYSEVYVVKYWSDAIPIQNNMKNNIALRLVLEYTICNVQQLSIPVFRCLKAWVCSHSLGVWV